MKNEITKYNAALLLGCFALCIKIGLQIWARKHGYCVPLPAIFAELFSTPGITSRLLIFMIFLGVLGLLYVFGVIGRWWNCP